MKSLPRRIVLTPQTVKDLIEHHLYACSLVNDDDEFTIEFDWFHFSKDEFPIILTPIKITKVKGGTSISFND